MEAAAVLARQLGAVVLLKGHRTVITDGVRGYENPTGNPGMATGGSGDVLAGLLTSLLGQGLPALEAAACAACLVQLNSQAFRRGLAYLSACVGIVCGIHMLEAGYDIASYWMMDHVRTQTLRQEISELDEPAAASIISYGIEPYTKWCGAYGLPDIRENGEDSLALGRARWFGVTSITATETRTYPFAGHTNETYAAGEAAAENAESMD